MIYKPRNTEQVLGGASNVTDRMTAAQVATIRARANGTKRATPEADAQAELFAWKERNVGRIPSLRWLHSSGNGYHLGTPAARAQANRTGRVRGIWDVFLPYASYSNHDKEYYGGMYVEMKAPGKRLTPEQEDFRDDNASEFAFAVCHSSAEAIAAICSYLGVSDPEGGK